jgi:hypothetical protein
MMTIHRSFCRELSLITNVMSGDLSSLLRVKQRWPILLLVVLQIFTKFHKLLAELSKSFVCNHDFSGGIREGSAFRILPANICHPLGER